MTTKQKREKLLAYKRAYAKARREKMVARTNRSSTGSSSFAQIKAIVNELESIESKKVALVGALKAIKL